MEIVNTLALVFALVAIGYTLAWRGILRDGAGEALGDFVTTVAIPTLLFRTLSQADFGSVTPVTLWMTYFTSIMLTWVVATMLIRRGFGRDARSGVVAGLSASFSNLLLLGLPVTFALFGQAGTETLSLILAIHLPIMMATSVILNERAEIIDGLRDQQTDPWTTLRRILVSLASNPLVLGIVAGVIWRFLPAELPGFLSELIDRLAALAGTLALISLGLSLRRFGIARNVPQAATMTALKLLLMPCIATLMSLVFGLSPLQAEIVIVAAAMPTGVNPYLLATRFGTGEAIASNALLLSTLMAPITLLFWSFVARTIF
ncbi:AEC family transporter [Granulosicoccus sp. 3-233]|uniref:AEC family transporter n=1 Tax=Granulosicoccus sp. 3-233 TaxID=3417969 RepID=UPI003D32559B